jgi:hypothetical protein
MSQQRFYEKTPIVKQAVDAMFLFPGDIQGVIARGFSLIAEKDCKAKEMMDNLKTLGTDKVLAMYKSKQKKRHYDQNPDTHQAMNYLMIMNPESQVFIASKVIEMMGFMQEYLQLCKTYAQSPERESIHAISDTYVHQGPKEARVFLSSLNTEFRNRLLGLQPASNPPITHPLENKAPLASVASAAAGTTSIRTTRNGNEDGFGEAIRSEKAGMKIKGDLL